MKISLLKKAAVALLIFFTALGPLWPGALPAEPADENTGMLRYDSFGDLPPAQPLKFITHKGGAPGDPASGKPAEAANGGLPYEYNDAYDEDVNEWLRALFSSFSPLVSDDVWRILNNRRQVPWNILSQEIRQAVCRGFWWDTFNDYRDFLSAFDQPYMTTASFECGRVKASISSSCQRVSTHRGPECGATQIRLDDGEKQSEHFIFGRVKNLAPIGSAACYVVEGQSWLVLAALEDFQYGGGCIEGNECTLLSGRLDYFKNTEYIGTFEPKRPYSLMHGREDYFTDQHIPGLKSLAHQLIPFARPVYGPDSDEAYRTIDCMPDCGEDAGSWSGQRYTFQLYLHNATIDAVILRNDVEHIRSLQGNFLGFWPLLPLPRRAEAD